MAKRTKQRTSELLELISYVVLGADVIGILHHRMIISNAGMLLTRTLEESEAVQMSLKWDRINLNMCIFVFLFFAFFSFLNHLFNKKYNVKAQTALLIIYILIFIANLVSYHFY